MRTKQIAYLTLILGGFILQSCSGKIPQEDKNEKEQLPLVNIEEVMEKSFVHEIRVQGNVETDKDILLNAEMGGIITSINVKEGQTVQAGQSIATIDASLLSSNLDELQTQLEYAEYVLDKQKELQKRGVGSGFELETAENQVASLKSRMKSLNVQRGKATIKAPFTGVIDNIFARAGEMAGPQSPIVRLVNNNTIDITASISEKHLANIKVGTPIKVSFPNFRDTVIHLKITHVGNYIDPTNRTFRVMATLKNNKTLLPNMLAEVSITDLKIEKGLVIPSKSIMKDQNNNDFVYIAKETEKGFEVSKVNIQVIETFEGEALVKPSKDIKPGQKVVVEGAKGITENDIVAIKK